jgi:ketosteroid isomerase-like protein
MVLIYSCSFSSGNAQEKAKKAIAQAEKDFEKMAAEKGIAEAFSFFADSTAVIRGGNDSLIHGKEGIRNFFTADRFKTAVVKWSPDFADASTAGDLGYTYGRYTWSSKDSTGKITESNGVFHTVWKKQKDGNWKFVWD